jgi:hypothetical protein
MTQPNQNLYGIGFPSTFGQSVIYPHFDVRAPVNSSDVNYLVGQVWIWPSNGIWQLLNLSTTGGVLSANWIQLANSSGDLVVSAPLTTDGVLYATGANSTTSTGAGTSGQVLQSAGASSAPVYSTATYPSTTTINQLLYSTAANTIGGLTTADNGVLTTGTTGVPAITPLANGQVIMGQGAGSPPAAVYVSNTENTFVPKFTGIPSMSASTGGVAAVTINTYNIWSVPQWGAQFEQYNTTVSTAIAPSVSTTLGDGLDIDTITGAASKSIEITEGNTVNAKNAFVIGTSAAFYVKAAFSIATLADVTDLYVGFRKVQTYQATIPGGYTDYATIGVHSTAGLVELQTQVGGGGNTVTSTTQSVTASTIFTVEVLVSAGGVVTYLLNGVTPTAVAAYTFTSALTVIPYIIYSTSAGGHAEVDLASYQCGLQ